MTTILYGSLLLGAFIAGFVIGKEFPTPAHFRNALRRVLGIDEEKQ